jgi:hypothetical protein
MGLRECAEMVTDMDHAPVLVNCEQGLSEYFIRLTILPDLGFPMKRSLR